MKIIIAFYKANNPYGKLDDKLIGKWTKGSYSHVEIFAPENGKRYTSSGRAGGVVKRDIRNQLERKEVWDFVEIELKNTTIEDLERIYEKTKNDKYDWFAIFGFIIPLRDRTNKWICSEWCANFLKCNKYDKLEIYEPSRLSPNDLYRIIKE